MIDGIEHLEHLLSHQFVITIHKETDFIGFAVLGDGHVDVGHCSHLFFIGDEDDLAGQVFVLLEEVLDEGSGVIGGGVIDDHHPVVAVVLVEDRLQVVLVPEVLGIVEARNDDAEGQLSGVVAEVVGLLQSRLLLLQLLLDLPALYRVDEGSLDVSSLHHPWVPFFLRLEILALDQLIELLILGVAYDFFSVVL